MFSQPRLERANIIHYIGTILIAVSIGLAFFSFILIGYLLNRVEFNDGSGSIDPELAANLGSLLSGLLTPLLSFSTLLILVISIYAQRLTTRILQYESHVLKLIEFHRENVHQIQFSVKDDTLSLLEKDCSGQLFFEHAVDEYRRIFKAASSACEEYKAAIPKRDILNVSYLLFYFGAQHVGKSDSHAILDMAIEKSDPVFWRQFVKEKIIPLQKDGYACGHQGRLNQYFRHIFRSIYYIDDQTSLPSDKRYYFAGLYANQMSSNEVILYFLNSLSSLGESTIEKNYIVKYRFIRNIPQNCIIGVNPKEYFDIHYSWEAS